MSARAATKRLWQPSGRTKLHVSELRLRSYFRYLEDRPRGLVAFRLGHEGPLGASQLEWLFTLYHDCAGKLASGGDFE